MPLTRLNPGPAAFNQTAVAVSTRLFTQLHVPVRDVEEMLPAIVILRPEIDLDERTPLRPLRFADEMHVRFQRRAIRLPGIARNARAHNVLPRRRAAPVPRDHMVQIQILPFKYLPAILAGVLVAFEDIVSRELHFFLRHAIEQHQHDHSRNPDAKRNGVNAFRVRLRLGNIVPLLEIVSLK